MRRDGLLPEDRSDIRLVDDAKRDAWLTEEQRRQPKPPSKADLEAIYERIKARREKP